MSNGRNKVRNARSKALDRDGSRFIALPTVVLQAPSYLGLSHPARSLLLELALQYAGDNNGRLILTRAFMRKRGWTSSDTLTSAKKELLEAGLVHETVTGHRPNKASWYALTFYSLDRIPGYDYGAVETFKRGAYREASPLSKNTNPRPPNGTKRGGVVPSGGTAKPALVPPAGAMAAGLSIPAVPPDGHLLEKPSAREQKSLEGGPVKQGGQSSKTQRTSIDTLDDLWAAVGCRTQPMGCR